MERLGLQICPLVSEAQEGTCLLPPSASSLGLSLSASATGILMNVPPECCADRGQARRGSETFVGDVASLKRALSSDLSSNPFLPLNYLGILGKLQVASVFLST